MPKKPQKKRRLNKRESRRIRRRLRPLPRETRSQPLILRRPQSKK